jgi:hypothetical protein
MAGTESVTRQEANSVSDFPIQAESEHLFARGTGRRDEVSSAVLVRRLNR